MESGTKLLRNEQKTQRAEQRQADLEATDAARRHDELQAIRVWKFERRHAAALRFVDRAAARAVQRLNANGGEGWQRHGKLITVCRRFGPHWSFWCWTHRRTIAVAQIPDMSRDEYRRYRRPATMHFYIGADGKVYRDGLDKTYRAELHERAWPKEITQVAKKINRICT